MKNIGDKFSLIIPTYNRWNKLDILLKSVETMDPRPSEIIVIDDNSADGTCENSRKKYPFVKVIELNRRFGTSLAKNIGIALSKNEYLWFLDSDCEVIYPDLLNSFNKMLDEKSVGAAGGEGFYDKNKNIYFKIKSFYPNLQTKEEFLKAENVNNMHVGFSATCNFAVKRELMKRLKGFNNYLDIGEDKEICCLMKKSYSLSIIEDSKFAVIHHSSSRSIEGSFKILLKEQSDIIKIGLLCFPLCKLMVFPLLDIISKISKLRDKTKYLNKDLMFENSPQKMLKEYMNGPFLKIKFYLIMLVTTAGAYICALIFSPKILLVRFFRPDFLEISKKKAGI